MNSDDWLSWMVVADAERRRALEEAEEYEDDILDEYDQWCEEHGIPPMPRSDLESHRPTASGCLCLPLIGLALLMGAAAVLWGC